MALGLECYWLRVEASEGFEFLGSSGSGFRASGSNGYRV